MERKILTALEVIKLQMSNQAQVLRELKQQLGSDKAGDEPPTDISLPVQTEEELGYLEDKLKDELAAKQVVGRNSYQILKSKGQTLLKVQAIIGLCLCWGIDLYKASKTVADLEGGAAGARPLYFLQKIHRARAQVPPAL